jgi:hypothetical protein
VEGVLIIYLTEKNRSFGIVAACKLCMGNTPKFPKDAAPDIRDILTLNGEETTEAERE